ncbi:glycosyltransferase family 2 protein [Desulfoprunum benzoelyticum]|uniref:Rhamnosyltransferase n=1 Tax=Desulfoprunum benzoelyticum TaxID=1506996 RepID=A0A840V1U8_9BACT|nr:rhamnosyltransferase [Desulfoprunum benzoelyticum]MBM9529283.1 glycosyltransferase family 2 protein [Desulfoprunum benzoelyticum]
MLENIKSKCIARVQKREKKVAAIIVTYNPNLFIFEKELNAIEVQCFVIVVDNGSDDEFMTFILQKKQNLEHLNVIFLKRNLGIAKALNVGIETAIKLGFDFALLLDHDSIPDNNLVEVLTCHLEILIEGKEKIAAIGPRLFDPRSEKELGFAVLHNFIWKKVKCGNCSCSILPCQFINSSGSFINLSAWQIIGKFDEAFFIDHVETDWYMRARHLAYQCFGDCSTTLNHNLGDDVVNFWFFGWRTMPRRSPKRHYTIVRNSLWLYNKPYTPFAWKVNNCIKLIFTLVWFSLFDQDRKSQFKYILKGINDGIFTSAKSIKGKTIS